MSRGHSRRRAEPDRKGVEMSIVIAVDDSSIAEAVCRAVGPQLRRDETTAYLMTVIDPGEVQGQRGGSAPAQYHSEMASADLSGGQLGAGATRGPQLPPAAEDRGQALASVEDERRHYLERLASEHLDGVTCEYHVVAADDVSSGDRRLRRGDRCDLDRDGHARAHRHPALPQRKRRRGRDPQGRRAGVRGSRGMRVAEE